MRGGRCSPLGGGQSARPRLSGAGSVWDHLAMFALQFFFLLCSLLLFTFLQSFDPSKSSPGDSRIPPGRPRGVQQTPPFSNFFWVLFLEPQNDAQSSENDPQRAPQRRPKSAQNREKWAPGPVPMATPILDAFLERPWEGLCAPNIANNISNSHRALVQKVTFWLPFGFHFGAFSGPFWLFWRSRGLSKIRCKKRLPKKQPRDRKWPTMASQMGSHICRQAPPQRCCCHLFPTCVLQGLPDAKMTPKCSKMVPKWCQNYPKMVPKLCREGPPSHASCHEISQQTLPRILR